MKIKLFLFLAILCNLFLTAQVKEGFNVPKNAKIGLSLSGGGAKGFGAGAQGAGELERAADAGFHHPAAAIGGAAAAGAGAGPQRPHAGGGV